MLVRQNRNYFIGSDLPRGNAYVRFRALNKPNENTFRHVFNSVLMPLEVEDTAKDSVAGHSRTAIDNDIVIRKASYNDGHTRFVRPHQIPVGANSVKNTNLTYELINDEATPGSNKYYGTNAAGEKGFHAVSGGGSFCLIDLPVGPCTERNYVAGQITVEKTLVIPEAYLVVGNRLHYTFFYCASTYDSPTKVFANVLKSKGDSYQQIWNSADDFAAPMGTSINPYTTLCKCSVVVDVLESGLFINGYNEYHKHGDGEYEAGRSCCYDGGPLQMPVGDLFVQLSYQIYHVASTFSYGRSELHVFKTTPFEAIV